jgi:type IV secretion system protein VirB4
MIRLSEIAKDYQEAGAMNTLIGLSAFVDERCFLTKSGDLGVVFGVEGIDGECLDHAQLDQAARRFEAGVRIFNENFRLYQYMLKRDGARLPHLDYQNPVVQQAIANRIAYLESKSGDLYTHELYYVLVYEGWHRTRSTLDALRAFPRRPRQTVTEFLSARAQTTVYAEELERASEVLLNKAQNFEVQLGETLGVRLLGKAEAFRFFRQLLNYSPTKQHVELKYDSHVDYFAADSALECHRDHLRLDDYYVQVLTLKEPPSQTFARLLGDLESLPANYVIASEWKRESNFAARQEINSKRRHFHNAKSSLSNYLGGQQPSREEMLIDDGASAVVADLGECLRELEVNGAYFGTFSLTLVLYSLDRTKLAKAVAECFKIFSTHDAVLVEERYNLLNAFLAVVPGNSVYNLRRMWLQNTNYADLSFLFSLRTGEPENRHLGEEYLAILETSSATPYFLNLHYQDIAHTMILGATGSGKSFFLNFLLTNLQKYQPLTCIFDLGGSYENLTRLFEGSYLQVGIEQRSFTINPFRMEPTRENLHFLFSFVRVLIESGGYQLTSQDERDLYEQVENVYVVDPEQRRLFTLANILNRNLSQHLHKWVQGGQYGALFDNAEDNLTFARFQTFDFEGMDKYPQVLEPLLFYILHRANASIYSPELATTFKAFVMDEAWRFLRNDTIRRYITEAVKTWRKRNAAMILATQSSDDLESSEMLSVIVESCATKIFLANPGADRASYQETFHLNETESELIARLVPKQQILLKRPDYSKALNLNVDRVGYWLYTSNPYESQQRREAFEKHGFAQGLEILRRSAT